jgi:hypothetical protein
MYINLSPVYKSLPSLQLDSITMTALAYYADKAVFLAAIANYTIHGNHNGAIFSATTAITHIAASTTAITCVTSSCDSSVAGIASSTDCVAVPI